jgi:hypothetical protein
MGVGVVGPSLFPQAEKEITKNPARKSATVMFFFISRPR